MLDLKKLKALELPKKEIEIEILGDTQKVEIQALDDESALRIAGISSNTSLPDGEREIQIRREILKNGIPGITNDDIDVLAKRAGVISIELMTAIRDLTVEYNDVRNNARKEAKKKSAKAASPKESN